MANFDDISIPVQYPALIAAHARNSQFSPAPAAPDFDARIAEAKAHAQHVESLRGWAMLAARGHAGAQQVMAHPDVQAKLGTRIPLPTSAPVAPTKVVTPQPPRVVPAVPALPQPSPHADGVAGRVSLLTNLLTPPVPPDLI